VRAVAQGKGPETSVRDVMTDEVRYCFEDEDTDAVERNMADIQFRRLPVLNRDKRFVGILSLGHLAVHDKAAKVGCCDGRHLAAGWPAQPDRRPAALSLRYSTIRQEACHARHPLGDLEALAQGLVGPAH
jgi:CBS-domain-containing membrane protein